MNTFKTKKGTELPLTNLKGKDYLMVQWRLVWFREEHPDWSIITEFTSADATGALAKAAVWNKEGQIMATAHKYEDKQGFGDYREKAETGAIGRALALCGYGTQFCADELDEGDRIADSPVERPPVVGVHYIRPEAPGPKDGYPETGIYRIPFGQWKTRTLEQVSNDFGLEKIKDYIKYLEESAAKKGEQIKPAVAEFIVNASDFIGAFENTSPDDWRNQQDVK